MKEKSIKGITLVALVITIVILLILAGITIAQITGENGLFKRALQAREESQYANAEEKVKLAVNASYDENGSLSKELLKDNVNDIKGIQEKVESVQFPQTVKVDGYEFIISEIGSITCVGKNDTPPENTPDTEAGKEVALKDGWGTQSVTYYKTTDGTEVTGLTTVSKVYAVSVGNGETVPVPKEFYYVGGDFSTGVVISDNKDDQNKYAGKNTDGTIKAVGTDLIGNQFVWIPCDETTYKKTSWGQGNVTNRSNSYWDTTLSGSELPQIQKYGGFYVARYESGLDTSKAHTTSLAYNSNYHDSETVKPQSKAGLIPWNFVSWNTAEARSKEMYNTTSVASGLITGAQWDTMINTINAKTGASLTNSDWGNYDNTAITYTGMAATSNDSNDTLGTFTGTGGTTNASTGTKQLLMTGSSTQFMKYNLYDVAGNVWEWTEEVSYYGGNVAIEYRVPRGRLFLRRSIKLSRLLSQWSRFRRYGHCQHSWFPSCTFH